MTDANKVAGLPVPGYVDQNAENIALVSSNKRHEERILRIVDELGKHDEFDKRWLALARTNIEIGFMALNRAIFRPKRINLPEDNEG